MLTESLRLTSPGDADWDEARRAWNLAVDQRPAAVAHPRSVEEVRAAIGYAREHDLRIAAQGTGHGAAPLGPLDGTLLIRTGRYGLAANSVRAVELVTAAGDIVRVSHEQERDLFWALRGGGGGFGVVCALELELFSVPRAYAGMLTFPAAHADEVLSAWRAWTVGAGDALTSTARLMQLPRAPELPEPLRGRRLVVIDGADLRPEAAATAELATLRALGPELDTFASSPATGLVDRLHMGPYLGRPQPVPALVEHALLDDLPADALRSIVPAALAGLDAGLAMIELRHLGGALGTAPPAAGALSHLDAEYALLAVGLTVGLGASAGIDAAIDTVLAAAEPWSGGWVYRTSSNAALLTAERSPTPTAGACGRSRPCTTPRTASAPPSPSSSDQRNNHEPAHHPAAASHHAPARGRRPGGRR